MKGIISNYILSIQPSATSSSAPTAEMGFTSSHDFTDMTKLYTDAGVTNVTANGQSIYRAADLLGSVANTYFDQATGANRPVFTTGGANGKSYGNFDGANSFMEMGTNMTNIFTASAKTFIIACSIEAGWAANDQPMGNSGSLITSILKAGPLICFRNYDGTNDDTAGQSIVQGTPFVYAAKHDSGNIYDRLNGGTWGAGVASGNTGSTWATNPLRLASRSTNYTPMKLYFCATANVVVSDANLALVENYYKAQLGIA